MSTQDILNHHQIEIKIQRMACEIAECYVGHHSLVICGLNTRGYFLATLLAKGIKVFSPSLVVQLVQVTNDKEILFKPETSLEKTHVLLVDDVINSGRTLMDVFQHIFVQKPISIRTAFLAKREHRAFPVKADFVGISLATTIKEHVHFDNDNIKNLKVYLK